MGIMFSTVGFLGMTGLRLGIVQSFLGDDDPYPGIGDAEPMGHIVFLVLLALGMTFTIIWGIKNQSTYMEKKEAERELEEVDSELQEEAESIEELEEYEEIDEYEDEEEYEEIEEYEDEETEVLVEG